jgi:putative phosphoesterase
MPQKSITRTIDFSGVENPVIAVVSDTHGRPHPGLLPALKEMRSSLILHTGDVGDQRILTELGRICEVLFVRGNVDPRGPGWPDAMTLHLRLGEEHRLNLLLLHFAMVDLRLNNMALSLLRQSPAEIVVFGHSHIPFLGVDGKITLFNPGSAGPRRFRLPVTMGLIEISAHRVTFKHLDLQTGKAWRPQ